MSLRLVQRVMLTSGIAILILVSFSVVVLATPAEDADAELGQYLKCLDVFTFVPAGYNAKERTTRASYHDILRSRL